MKKTSSVIAFRCPPEVTREIDDQCKPLNLSRGDWVRAAVLSRVQDANPQLLSEDLGRIEQRIEEMEGTLKQFEARLKQLDGNVAKATFLILTRHQLDKKFAKALVQRLLIPKEDRA